MNREVSAELQEEVENVSLKISGDVPKWLSGTLVRNGPIKVMIDGQSNVHWFDGLAMLHAFSFKEGTVTYSNKFLRSDAYEAVFKQGSLKYIGFACDPCRSLFKKFLTFFIPQSPLIQNANVNVAKIADQYVALTEVPLPVKFDLKTLETLGVLDYQDELPKDKCWESAHPHLNSINYLIQFGRKSHYIIYQIEAGSSARKVIAEVPVEEPSYMHSFAITENYVILTQYPFVVKPLDLILKNQPFIKNFSWQPQKGTQFLVVNRKNGEIVGKYGTRPFFAFHHANAFEKEGTIYLDIVTYEDAKIIGNLHVNNEPHDDSSHTQLERFALCNGVITPEILLSKSSEFPRINDKYDGKPYNYLYLVGFSDEHKNEFPSAQGLYKINTTTKEVIVWFEKGCSAGEPVFVATPGATKEDDGVILSLIIDPIHNDSFLLILDAQSFKELARARAPHQIPLGFHGQYF